MHVLTLKNYPSEASIMVARQLKVVSQSDAFTISATRNIQYVFKKLVYLIVFCERHIRHLSKQHISYYILITLGFLMFR